MAVVLATAVAALPPPLSAQQEFPDFDRGAVGLGLALRRLSTTARILCVTAHPDDENNAVLVALSRGRGASTALLTLTRGEGGQNAIGPELGEALGVLRTEELLAVHRVDGAAQFFAHAYDFGFTFSLEETLARWGEEETLADIVRVLRLFRPDLVLSLPRDAPDHQHHVAAARLTAVAFRAAADPSRFPEQLQEGLRPWQARALYEGGVGGAPVSGPHPITVETTHEDPLLGMSAAELGSVARAFHKSQGMLQLRILPGEALDARFVAMDAEPPLAAPPSDLIEIADPGGLARFLPPDARSALEPLLRALASGVETARNGFDARSPHATAPALANLVRVLGDLASRVRSVGMDDAARFEFLFRLATEEAEAQAALALAEGVSLQAFAEDAEVVPGQTFTVNANVDHRGPASVQIEDVYLETPEGWRVDREPGALQELVAEKGLIVPFTVQVRATASPTRPFLHKAGGSDRYVLLAPQYRNLPFAPPDLVATLRYRVHDVVAAVSSPVLFRYPGRWVGGEKRRAVVVVPDLSVRLAPEILVFPSAAAASREVRVSVRNRRRAALQASVRLEVPDGWTVTPGEDVIDVAGEDEEATVRFALSPPAESKDGETSIRAVVKSGGREFREEFRPIAYHHIQERQIDREASARALVLDVRTAAGVSVGYVMGVGDEVVAALRQLGIPVTLLTPDDLAFGDLSRFTTITIGVRGYQARPDLRTHHRRLMRFVEDGGHLVVQYQRSEFNPTDGGPSPYAPFPARVTTKRVTDETAPLEMLLPESALLTTPNRLGPPDFAGWVQERGIQLLEPQDPRYRDLLASTDGFPGNPGRKTGLLVDAPVGKGSWTYVGLVLFRQLPAGVPGAYRLLADLISRPRGH